MKVWIGSVDSQRGLITWRWSTESTQGSETIRGIRIPHTVWAAGPEVVSEALLALFTLLVQDLRGGWRVRRVFIEEVPFNEQLLGRMSSVLAWMMREPDQVPRLPRGLGR